MPLKSSIWSRPERFAASIFHTPWNNFNSSSGSAARAAEASNKSDAEMSRSIASPLLSEDDSEGILHGAERFSGREQAIEPRARFHRIESQTHQRQIHILDQLAIYCRDGWSGAGVASAGCSFVAD